MMAKYKLTVPTLAELLRMAKAAHSIHEDKIGVPDPNWPEWYAAYIIEQLEQS
jgi:hypothetical protein